MNTLHTLEWWWLALALLAPLALWRMADGRRRSQVAYSSVALLRAAGTSWVARTRWIVWTLRALAIVLLAVCIARPVIAHQQTKVFVEGAALELVVDRSGSMRALDFEIDGSPVDRLEAVKDVASAFVLGGGGLRGRPNDLVGVVTFARFADGLSPLTLDHGYVIDALRAVTPADDTAEGGTAIGDAVALAVERLRDTMQHAAETAGRDPIKSAAIILLTDGEDNAGAVDPRVAADLAATYGIKIYAIGVGTRGMAPFPVGTDPFGRTIIRNVPVSIDEELMREMAAKTGGKYFRATDTASLEAIYEEIDLLEKAKTEERQAYRFTDLAVQPSGLAGQSTPPLLIGVLLLVGAELLLVTTRYRSLT